MEGSALPGEKKRAHPPLWKRVLRTALLAVVAIFALGWGAIVFFEDRLIYFPQLGSEVVGPSPGEEVWLTASDGVQIHGWYLPHPEAKLTMLVFHGNGGNMEGRRSWYQDLRGLKVNVLAIDYHGYGKSGGKPNEPALYADARASYEWLLKRTTADRIVLYGESLGGGPVCELASTSPVGGVILQSTYTSAKDMSRLVMPFFPARWFMKTSFDNLSKVPKITCPKLFLHGRMDEIVPFQMGETLYAAAAEPKQFAWILGGGHNDLPGRKKYSTALESFLASLAK